MNFNIERLEYANRNPDKHTKKVGRFSATDLYAICTNKITPEAFLNPPKIDSKGSLNCLRGEMVEWAVSRVWERSGAKFDTQRKDVITIDGIEYVAVADFHFGDKILECKSPEKFTGFKDYNKYQCELQYRIFNVPIYIGYYNLVDGQLTEQGSYKYEPNDKLWQTILTKTKEFNQKLIEYEKRQNKNT